MPSEYANDLMARVGLDTTEWKKGITDLNAGIKHIETGFQASAALMDDWSNSSEGLNKRLSSLTDKLELQKKKLEVLKQAYDEEVAANGESSKAAENLAKQMYNVQSEIKRTEKNLDTYSSKLEKMGDKAGKVANKLNDLSGKTRNLSIAAGAGLTALGAGLVKAGKSADELNTLAKQTGLTTEEIQKFKYASDIIDVGLEDLTGSLRKMTRNMISTSAEVKGAWETLGVSTVDANGQAKDVVQTFYEVADALSKVKNETERDQLAMLIFGKSANDLAGVLDDGGAALRQLGQEAEDLGLIMSQDAVDGANEFNDVIDKMKATITAELGKAFSENAAQLTDTMQSLANTIVSVIKFFTNLPAPVQKGAVAIMALTAALSPLLKISSSGIKIFTSVKKAILGKVAAHKAAKTATVAETVAVDANAAANETAAVAATKNSTATRALGTAAKAATPYLIALGAAIAFFSHMNKKYDAEVNAIYDSIDEKRNGYYDAELENIQKSLDAEQTAIAEKTSAIESYYDTKIDNLDEDLEATKEAIESERALYEKAHEARMDQLEEERDLKLANIKTESTKQISAIQQQIDALNALTEAEDNEEQRREDEKKLQELKNAIRDASTYAEKVEAEQEYSDFVRELARKEEREKRALQIKELQNQIQTIEEETENRENQVNAEYEAARKLEEEKLKLTQEYYDKRLKDLEGFIEKSTAKLESAKAKEIADTTAMYEETIKQLETELKLVNLRKTAAQEASDAARKAALNVPWYATAFDAGRYAYAGLTFNTSPELQAQIDALTPQEKAQLYLMNNPKPSLATYQKILAGNANGTAYWRGGLTRINEMGGEILNLPRGTQIIPHDVSMEMARAAAQASVTNSTTNTTTNNYGAQQQVTVLEVSGKKVATVIEPTVSVKMSNNIYGRRRSGGR